MKRSIIMGLSVILVTSGICNISYAKNNKNKELPPGLQKKVERGQSLPPGWQKKLVVGKVLDRDIYDQGVIVASDDKGFVTIEIEGKLVKLVKDTREIVQILNGK